MRNRAFSLPARNEGARLAAIIAGRAAIHSTATMAGAQARFRFNAEDNRASHRAGPPPARQANATQDIGAHDHSRTRPVLTKYPSRRLACPVAGPLVGAISTLLIMNFYSLPIGETHAILA